MSLPVALGDEKLHIVQSLRVKLLVLSAKFTSVVLPDFQLGHLVGFLRIGESFPELIDSEGHLAEVDED